MTLSSALSSSLHSSISLLVAIFTRGGVIRAILAGIAGITIIFFIVRISLQKLGGSANREEHSQQSSVNWESVRRYEVSGEGSALSPKPSSLQPSCISQERTSNPRRTACICSSEDPPLSGAASSDTITDICSSESPTSERDSRVQDEPRLSPFPPEILLVIFEYISIQHEISPDHFMLSTLFSLRRVCKGWREIIDGTSRLWPSLHPPLNEKGCERCIEWYMRITRGMSKVANLVVLELPKEGRGLHPRLFDHQLDLAISSFAMKVIIPNRFSWGIDGLASFLESTPTLVIPSDGPAMENLRKLHWTMGSHYFASQLAQSIGLPWTSLHQLPWTQLTHITLEMLMTLDDCNFILNHSPLVEHLSLREISGEPLSTANRWTERKICPHLHTLKIVSAVNISSLLRNYGLPCLRVVDFDLTEIDSATDLLQTAISWKELTYVTLSCVFSVDLMESIVAELDTVEVLVLKGQLPNPDAVWTVSHTLRSLKSFTLVPIADAAALNLMSHFVEHVLPSSIEFIDAPLAVHTFQQIINHPFDSLKVVKMKNHCISPHDFLSFLASSDNLVEGSFTVSDHHEIPPSLLSPSGVFLSISAPPRHQIICCIAKLDLHLGYQFTAANPLLEVLDLPKLSMLKFSASRKSSPCHALHQLLVRSRCSLSSLSFDCPTTDASKALQLLHLMSSTLENFEIKNEVGFGKALWIPLTHRGRGALSEQCLCPRLDRLAVAPCRDPHYFYEMVESRSKFPDNCECGLRKLMSVEAVVEADVDDPQVRLNFTNRLKARYIDCKLDFMLRFEH